MGHRDGLLMTLNLSEAKNHGCRPHPRGSVRRASGFVLTGYPEIEVQPSPTVPLRPHNSACNVESRLSHIIMMTLHTVQYQNHPDHRLAAPSLRPPCRDKALTTSNVANVQQSG